MGFDWMGNLFSQVLTMSAAAGMIICVVMGVRLCLRRAPKIFSYLLWSVVLFRLLCPAALPSPFSVFGIWEASVLPRSESVAHVLLDGWTDTAQSAKTASSASGNADKGEAFFVRNPDVSASSAMESDSGELFRAGKPDSGELFRAGKPNSGELFASGNTDMGVPSAAGNADKGAAFAADNPDMGVSSATGESGAEELFTTGKSDAGELFASGNADMSVSSASGNADKGAASIIGNAALKAASFLETANIWLIWLLGMACMAGYGVISTVRLKKRLAGAVCVRNNIYSSDSIDTPFAMGIFAPKIYLPDFLAETEKGYIILHEQTHIRRGDLLVKLLAYAALAVHWFNPLVWMAFLAAEKDMEMSCDEMVMAQMKEDIRAEYSTSLLCLATGKTMIGGTPLAFGEGSTKSRIKNIMRYRKPSSFVMCMTAVLVTGCLIGCGTNPGGQWKTAPAADEQQNQASDSGGGQKESAPDSDNRQKESVSDSDNGQKESASDSGGGQEDPISESGDGQGSGEAVYERIYSVDLDIEKETIPFEIWVASDEEKLIKINGQELAIAPELARGLKYEKAETTAYYDFNGDGNREIALIDTGAAAGGPLQTIQVFENRDGQWKEMELPSGLYDAFPDFVGEKLAEQGIRGKESDLVYYRTVSLSYENEKITMNYKLFTEDLTVAVGTVQKAVVYDPKQQGFVLEEDTSFVPALSGESAYHAYENTYSAKVETGTEEVLFEVWRGSVSGDMVVRIDGQEIPVSNEEASGNYGGGTVKIITHDFNGDKKEEIILLDGHRSQSCLIFGNTDGKWEKIDVPYEMYCVNDTDFLKRELENRKVYDSFDSCERSISFDQDKILVDYWFYTGTGAGSILFGTLKKEIYYDSDKKGFVWNEDAEFDYENQESF